MFQIQCKLFVFDKASQSWVERGRGLLRLNDMASTDDGTLQSRLGEPWRGPGVVQWSPRPEGQDPRADPHGRAPGTHTPWPAGPGLIPRLSQPALPRLSSLWV